MLMTSFTYGGHPLASTVGLAVLDIVEQENLPANAAHRGDIFSINCCHLNHAFTP
ncbi:MAG: hypothetical protein ACSLEN_05475 [Candidatus Malihini olakiniferum]